jgi:hypothetical protein
MIFIFPCKKMSKLKQTLKVTLQYLSSVSMNVMMSLMHSVDYTHHDCKDKSLRQIAVGIKPCIVK